MPGDQQIKVNPLLLTWARMESGYGTDHVAKRLHVKGERVAEWERGERQPTLRQVESLAHFFHRPLSVFFMSRPPQLPPLAAEYRRLPNIEPGSESPELRLALRQMLSRRENALNLMGELGQPIPEFSLRAHLRESPAEVGQRLREATGVTVATQLRWANEWESWRDWRAAGETMGVLVFQFIKVPLTEVRGLALLRTPMPVAAINGKEIPEARAFTLFHEIVHLMLAAGNEETSAARENRRGEEWMDVERFAEMAASHTLVPEDTLHDLVRQVGTPGAWDMDNVRRLAKRFKVTPLAMATRLRESRFINWTQYDEWRAQWQAYVDALPPRRGGFATPVQKAVNRAGQPFAKLVLEALAANRLTCADASRYLDLKFEHFDQLRTHLMRGPGDILTNE